MAGSFPALASGDVLLYPATRSTGPAVKSLTFANDFVKRWVAAPILENWRAEWTGLDATDATAIETFFLAQKGMADTTWDLNVDGLTLGKMSFDSDELVRVEIPDRPNRWSITAALRQVGATIAFPGAAAVFPSIRAGVFTQTPYSRTIRFSTIRSDSPGYSYRFAQQANPRFLFHLSYSAITPSEADTLRNFFLAMRGPYSAFTFTDEDGAEHTCHFEQNAIEIRYQGPNSRATELRLIT